MSDLTTLELLNSSARYFDLQTKPELLFQFWHTLENIHTSMPI